MCNIHVKNAHFQKMTQFYKKVFTFYSKNVEILQWNIANSLSITKTFVKSSVLQQK